jgi:integrase
MPIKERGGVWHVHVQVGSVRVRRTAGKGATKKEAKELEADIRKQLHDDRHAKRLDRGLNRTFGDGLLEYLNSEETKKLRSYRSLIDKARALRPHLERVRMEDVPIAAENMKQALLADGLQPATINRRLAIVRRILNLAYRRWGWLKAPLYITLLPEDNERHIYPSVDLVNKLAEACASKDAGDFFRVAYFTGLRKSELLRVNADPARHIIDGRIVLDSQTKTGRPGVVPIANDIMPIIKRMPLSVSNNMLRKNFEAARTAVGRPDLHVHDLRHGFASLLAESGADFLDIMVLMRHTSPASTKRYTHLVDARLKKAVARMSRKVAARK